MTRRVGGLWPEVVAFANLAASARRAALGKRHQTKVAAFLERVEPEALALQAELCSKRYRPGPLARFTINDPKQREIAVAPFRDRVVHHAVIDVLEPHFDRRMIASSFACRRGKGTHAALDHAQANCRRFASGWFLKLDIAQCFASLRHDVVLDTVGGIIKDRHVLDLLRVIVEHGGASGRGLPIGHLTSQWLANLVLDRLDHVVVERLGARGYARYMDDFVVFASHRAWLRGAWRDIAAFVGETLDLRLKARAFVLPMHHLARPRASNATMLVQCM